jgi:hypothetical protein
VIANGESNATSFALQSNTLLNSYSDLKTIFGCWTSASRVAVIPTLVTHNALLWYPVQVDINSLHLLFVVIYSFYAALLLSSMKGRYLQIDCCFVSFRRTILLTGNRYVAIGMFTQCFLCGCSTQSTIGRST